MPVRRWPRCDWRWPPGASRGPAFPTAGRWPGPWPRLRSCQLGSDHPFALAVAERYLGSLWLSPLWNPCKPRLLLRKRPVAILVRDHADGQRPAHVECRIVITRTAHRIRRIEGRGHVVDLGAVLEGLEAVPALFGHIQHPAILRAQFYAAPPSVSGRSRPQVEHHVMHAAAGAAYQLRLERRSNLEMHAPNRTLVDTESHIGLQRH